MSIALEGTIEIVRANVRLVRTRLGMTVLQFAKANPSAFLFYLIN